MSYTALYRKWRPTSFEEVRGQDHIVKTLKNQINSGRIGHAYLFCGTRGTGKTSIAKIFARAVNCEHPVDGSPCGECSMCRQIAEGASLNVVEIDAASTMVWKISAISGSRCSTRRRTGATASTSLTRFICFRLARSMRS